MGISGLGPTTGKNGHSQQNPLAKTLLELLQAQNQQTEIPVNPSTQLQEVSTRYIAEQADIFRLLVARGPPGTDLHWLNLSAQLRAPSLNELREKYFKDLHPSRQDNMGVDERLGRMRTTEDDSSLTEACFRDDFVQMR